MKTIVMTGATSFLGRNVLKGLLEKNYKVYALVRKTSPVLEQLPKNENVEYIYGSLQELELILEKVECADYFIHFAWDGSGNLGRADETIQKMNVKYSQKALDISYKLGCKKFIFPGSQAEYGIVHERIYEDTPCVPVSAYGKAKLEFSNWASEFSKEKTLEFIHLRIFSVYGPGDREGTLVDACVKKFNQGECMKLGPCTQKWNFLYISDFVEAVLAIINEQNIEGIYNIASGDTRTLREFVQEIYELSNKSGRYEFGEIAANPEGSPALDPDIERIKKAVGWYPKVLFSDGIREIMRGI